MQTNAEVPPPYENETMDAPFYFFRYYVGHTTKYGKEFLEFVVRGDGIVQYVNNSNYRRDSSIKKQLKVSPAVLREVQRLVIDSNILLCDDAKWPEPDRDGKQELEISMGNTHISFSTNKISLQADIARSNDPEGLGRFFYLVQHVKDMVFAMLGLHFKIKPV